jgi:hypothetical protein
MDRAVACLALGLDCNVVYAHHGLDDPIENRFGTLDRRLSSNVPYTYRF